MKQYYAFLLLFILSSSLGYSQQLVLVPDDSAEISAIVIDEFEPNDVHIGVINNTASNAIITWGMINYTAPLEWEVKLCDNNNCYDLLLNGGPYDASPIGAGDTLDLKFQYTAHCFTGTGNTNVFAYVSGDSANSVQILNYKANLTGNCPNAIPDAITEETLKIFPSSFQSHITVESAGILRVTSVKMYNTIGNLVKETKSLDASTIVLETARLSSGVYIVRIETTAGIISKRVIKE